MQHNRDCVNDVIIWQQQIKNVLRTKMGADPLKSHTQHIHWNWFYLHEMG
jgi:hypothetical protein